MKKIIIVITFLIGTIGCINSNSQKNENKINDPQMNDSLNLDYLFQTWYAKQILVNGKEDKENYPVNNDELTLKHDMTYVSIDRTYGNVDEGTWSIVKPNKFIIKTKEESVTFLISKITNDELITKMVSNEIEMIIKYTNKK